MRSDVVVVLSPLINFKASFVQASEPMLIQAFVSELAIQAFNKSVLCRLAWLDKAKRDIGFLAPEEHSFAGELSAIVADDLLGLPTFLA